MGCLCDKTKIEPSAQSSPQQPVDQPPSYDNIIRVKARELTVVDQIFHGPITLTINKQGVCRHFNKKMKDDLISPFNSLKEIFKYQL